MSKTDCFYRISIKALIFDETRKRFLILREANNIWEFPGGGLDQNESPEDCIKRELKEEAGLEVTSVGKDPLFFLTDQTKAGMWYANVFYETTVKNLKFIPSEECIALKFVSPREIGALEVYNNLRIFALSFPFEKNLAK